MKYNLTISVVLYNTDKEEIFNIIDIISRSKLNTKLYFIDNSPTMELGELIDKTDLIEYIYNGENLGFGRAHNIAINFARKNSDYHLILNSDVHFDPAILSEMLDYMELNKNIGLMSPKVLNPDGSLQYTARLLPTPGYLFIRRFLPLESVLKALDEKFELKSFNQKSVIDVPFFIGCFLLVKSSVFDKVLGYDERFFMYMEDVDLIRRIYSHYRTVYYPFCSIIHKHGKGSYKNKKLLRYHLDSSFKYFNKWGWFFDIERKQINRRILNQF